jgi:hypothetical protein
VRDSEVMELQEGGGGGVGVAVVQDWRRFEKCEAREEYWRGHAFPGFLPLGGGRDRNNGADCQ